MDEQIDRRMLKPECDNLEVNSASQIGEEHDNPSEDQASGLCECQDRLSYSPFLPADNHAYGPGPLFSPVYIPFFPGTSPRIVLSQHDVVYIRNHHRHQKTRGIRNLPITFMGKLASHNWGVKEGTNLVFLLCRERSRPSDCCRSIKIKVETNLQKALSCFLSKKAFCYQPRHKPQPTPWSV